MKTIQQLQTIGYSFQVKDDSIEYTYKGDGDPPPSMVEPLFRDLKENKQQALQYLQSSGENLMDRAARYFQEDVRVLMHSGLLEEQIVVLQNESIEAPEEHADKATYTLEELRHLVAHPPDPEDLKFLHESKKTFPGSRLTEVLPGGGEEVAWS